MRKWKMWSGSIHIQVIGKSLRPIHCLSTYCTSICICPKPDDMSFLSQTKKKSMLRRRVATKEKSPLKFHPGTFLYFPPAFGDIDGFAFALSSTHRRQKQRRCLNFNSFWEAFDAVVKNLVWCWCHIYVFISLTKKAPATNCRSMDFSVTLLSIFLQRSGRLNGQN